MTTSISYFFCDFSVEESLKASTILKSLIKRILSVFEKIPPEMERNFEERFLNSHREPGIEDLYTMLLDITQIPHTSYIIIDGLDECRADDRKRILTYMNQLMRDSKSRIKINTPLPAVTEWGKLTKVHNRQMGLIESTPWAITLRFKCTGIQRQHIRRQSQEERGPTRKFERLLSFIGIDMLGKIGFTTAVGFRRKTMRTGVYSII